MTTAAVDAQHVITAEKPRKKLSLGRDVVLLEVHRDASTGVTERIPSAHVVSLAAQLAGPPAAGTAAGWTR
ncbi:hypothetical protein [Protofrankia sp. BMG5.30]|uniref:hypothetical protein n=1 Tax=Protofrankia sp. BMG5.30 TaxID=1834514 RepID=UPI000977827C|nr:hypothetical protein [Protofrankia sp. BMG5.30]ONH32686.1 hypothetical protein BL254_21355 [Protofrankia sp. BMG5.30]